MSCLTARSRSAGTGNRILLAVNRSRYRVAKPAERVFRPISGEPFVPQKVVSATGAACSAGRIGFLQTGAVYRGFSVFVALYDWSLLAASVAP
ncbi:hypothetical protein MPSD_34630 [Mycobacterium pseudoshottsii JCM 15466]|uniref:Uncharacterized protein n=1 Tax=Mycobacterium pseudoshottsii TaxID=265949 RepID=A0A9N7LSC4_9MYCO|nr:hypothetical protein MPSD_34630 [Mycobacterium pseudoshottsii JCM 15466]BDN83181.1 hypothetical protein NJB1907Z4_C33960 [Mycobacterium pseudoshottsii]